MTDQLPPVTCTLSNDDAANQAIEWNELAERAHRVERIADGVKMIFPVALLARIEDLAAKEVACCTFLTIVTASVGDDVELVITSPNPDAAPVIDLIAGLSD